MVYNVNRKKGSKFQQPDFFMARQKGRQKAGPRAQAAAAAARPAGMAARYALPGERPPSRYGPGQADPLIQRFDNYMKAVQGTEVPKHAR